LVARTEKAFVVIGEAKADRPFRHLPRPKLIDLNKHLQKSVARNEQLHAAPRARHLNLRMDYRAEP
jgi:hypothetical protein